MTRGREDCEWTLLVLRDEPGVPNVPVGEEVHFYSTSLPGTGSQETSETTLEKGHTVIEVEMDCLF